MILSVAPPTPSCIARCVVGTYGWLSCIGVVCALRDLCVLGVREFVAQAVRVCRQKAQVSNKTSANVQIAIRPVTLQLSGTEVKLDFAAVTAAILVALTSPSGQRRVLDRGLAEKAHIRFIQTGLVALNKARETAARSAFSFYIWKPSFDERLSHRRCSFRNLNELWLS